MNVFREVFREIYRSFVDIKNNSIEILKFGFFPQLFISIGGSYFYYVDVNSEIGWGLYLYVFCAIFYVMSFILWTFVISRWSNFLFDPEVRATWASVILGRAVWRAAWAQIKLFPFFLAYIVSATSLTVLFIVYFDIQPRKEDLTFWLLPLPFLVGGLYLFSRLAPFVIARSLGLPETIRSTWRLMAGKRAWILLISLIVPIAAQAVLNFALKESLMWAVRKGNYAIFHKFHFAGMYAAQFVTSGAAEFVVSLLMVPVCLAMVFRALDAAIAERDARPPSVAMPIRQDAASIPGEA